MGTATLLKMLEPTTFTDQRLYALDPPLKDWNDNEVRHVVVSATFVTGFGCETYIFGSDETAENINYCELNGSFKGRVDHAQALRNAGYTIVEPPHD